MVSRVVATDKEHLTRLMCQAIQRDGLACDLNHIDVSTITSSDGLFNYSDFVGDISGWDVSAGESFRRMFHSSRFNGDISHWNMANALDLSHMFEEAWFTGDVSQWNVANARTMNGMFKNSQFTGDLSHWRPVELKNAGDMFARSRFTGDVSRWNPCNLKNASGMFNSKAFQGDLSNWTLAPYCETAGMLNPAYNGGLPRPQEDVKAHSYRAMMASESALHAHLARTPFSVAHAEMLAQDTASCTWASPQLAARAKELARVGKSMGLSHDDTVLALLAVQHDHEQGAFSASAQLSSLFECP